MYQIKGREAIGKLVEKELKLFIENEYGRKYSRELLIHALGLNFVERTSSYIHSILYQIKGEKCIKDQEYLDLIQNLSRKIAEEVAKPLFDEIVDSFDFDLYFQHIEERTTKEIRTTIKGNKKI